MRHIAFAAILSGLAVAGPNEDAILAADKAFNDMAQEKGVAAAFEAFAAPDARMFSGTGDLVQGPASIAKMMVEIYHTTGKLTWTPAEAVASADGTLGYSFGRFKYDSGPVEGGEAMKFGGTYVTVWERQADGAYKFDFDFGAPDSGPAE